MPKARRSKSHVARALAAAAVAVPLAAAAPAMGAPDAPDRIQVLAKLTPDAEVNAVEQRTGLRHEATIPEIRWAAFSFTGAARAAHLKLLRDPAVTRIDFRGPGERVSLNYTPSDTIFQQPGQVAAGQLTASWNWHWTETNFPAAWDIARGNGDVKVAVIDSEFDTEHIELKPKLLAGKNFDSGTPEYRTGNIRATANDLGTLHGSHVAGLVGAVSDNANGVTGACFDCVVAPYKISLRGGPPGGAETTDAKFVRDLTEALVDIGNRDDARVVNMSLGTQRPHAPMEEAIRMAVEKGKVLIAAAGNDQQSSPGVNQYPAAYPGVIGIGATQPDGNIAPFSSNGDFVDIAAPGHGIVSTWDQRVPANAQPPITAPTHGNGFTNLSGTSMASPMVAGLAGLMLQVRPDLTSAEVQQLLEESAVDLGASGKDQVFGAGRIDAVAALQATQGFVRPPASTTKVRVKLFLAGKLGRRTLKAGARRSFQRVARGASIRITGRTKPAARRTRLLVQRRVVSRRLAENATWRTVRRIRTNNRGRFGFVYRPRTLGKHTIRVFIQRNSKRVGAGSAPIKLRAVRR